MAQFVLMDNCSSDHNRVVDYTLIVTVLLAATAQLNHSLKQVQKWCVLDISSGSEYIILIILFSSQIL